MTVTLLVLHGFTLNGAAMRTALGGLAAQLSEHVELVFPDAPNVCTPGAVERLYQVWPMPRAEPPHLCWWDAVEDGRVYQGLERSLDVMRELVERHSPVALLGFSQGAMLAATLAALSTRAELPPLAFVVPVAGAVPRAAAVLDKFDRPVNVPSLHVWGERDKLSGPRSPELFERFEASSREMVTWGGGHSVPSSGDAASRIVDFVARQVRGLPAPPA
ncbi:MAG TPA: alpha/beta fold hydrolase [Polyangiaceae bacterium]|nr:alpha/beta fold hydrolase [Polyangiaceae bacterium]